MSNTGFIIGAIGLMVVIYILFIHNDGWKSKFEKVDDEVKLTIALNLLKEYDLFDAYEYNQPQLGYELYIAEAMLYHCHLGKIYYQTVIKA